MFKINYTKSHKKSDCYHLSKKKLQTKNQLVILPLPALNRVKHMSWVWLDFLEWYLFQLIVLLKQDYNSFNGFIFSWVDKRHFKCSPKFT